MHLANLSTVKNRKTGKHPFSRLTDGIDHPVTVTLAAAQADEPAKTPELRCSFALGRGQYCAKPANVAHTHGPKRWDSEIGTNVGFGGHGWDESECTFSSEVEGCRSGCKVYTQRGTGERVLAHNSSYGCTLTAERLAARLVTTDEGHGEERAVADWEREFLSA